MGGQIGLGGFRIWVWLDLIDGRGWQGCEMGLGFFFFLDFVFGVPDEGARWIEVEGGGSGGTIWGCWGFNELEKCFGEEILGFSMEGCR